MYTIKRYLHEYQEVIFEIRSKVQFAVDWKKVKALQVIRSSQTL